MDSIEGGYFLLFWGDFSPFHDNFCFYSDLSLPACSLFPPSLSLSLSLPPSLPPGHPKLEPKSLVDAGIAEAYADDYMFMGCIKYINSVSFPNKDFISSKKFSCLQCSITCIQLQSGTSSCACSCMHLYIWEKFSQYILLVCMYMYMYVHACNMRVLRSCIGFMAS